jgi:S1-C subfamily serine protease
VRIVEKDPVDTVLFYGIGLVVGTDGVIAANRKPIVQSNAYVATMSDGTTFTLMPINPEKKSDIILFKVNSSEKKADSTYIFAPAVLGDAEPKLGQTVVTVGGEEKNDIAVGRISSLETKNIGTTTAKYVTSIDTDLIFKDIESGSPLLNLTGSVIGIKLSSDTTKSFTPIALLKKELQALSETKSQ